MWLDSELNAQVEEVTKTYYTKDMLDNNRKEVWIPKESLYVLIENLVDIIKHKEDEIKILEKDIEENYKPIDKGSQY